MPAAAIRLKSFRPKQILRQQKINRLAAAPPTAERIGGWWWNEVLIIDSFFCLVVQPRLNSAPRFAILGRLKAVSREMANAMRWDWHLPTCYYLFAIKD